MHLKFIEKCYNNYRQQRVYFVFNNGIYSFIQNKGFNYDDIIYKWEEQINKTKYKVNNDTFDVGRTCLRAICNHSLGNVIYRLMKSDIDSEK